MVAISPTAEDAAWHAVRWWESMRAEYKLDYDHGNESRVIQFIERRIKTARIRLYLATNRPVLNIQQTGRFPFDWSQLPESGSFSRKSMEEAERELAESEARLAELKRRHEGGRKIADKQAFIDHWTSLPQAPGAIETYSNPHLLGRGFISSFDINFNGRTLRGLHEFRRELHSFNGVCWSPIPDHEAKGMLTRCIKQRFDQLAEERLKHANPEKPPPVSEPVTGQIISNTTNAVLSMVMLPSAIEAPAWLGGPHLLRNPHEFIRVRNGIIDAGTILDGAEPVLIPHDPRFFGTTFLPAVFDPAAQCPTWASFLEKNLQRNDDKIAMLQEFFGYCLTPDTSRQKFLMLEGEGANGKSVILAALRAMLGGDNVSHIPLEQFGERFALHQTVGKLANISAEIGDLDKAAEGILKAFTSGDRMSFDRKHKDPISAVPTARLVLATNNRPRFADKSAGLWRRMLLLPMPYRVTDDERIHGMDQPQFWESELSGILNWAIQGLAELRRYGRFTVAAESKTAMEDYRAEANPCREFLEEKYKFTGDEKDWVPTCDAYAAYRAWSEAGGYSPVNDRNFGREVSRLWTEAKKVRKGARDGRFWAYSGILPISSVTTEFELFTG